MTGAIRDELRTLISDLKRAADVHRQYPGHFQVTPDMILRLACIIERVLTETVPCGALSPIGGERCSLPKGHVDEHQHWQNGVPVTGWYGDYSRDPEALASETRRGERRERKPNG